MALEPFEEFSFVEDRAGADQGDQVRGVDRPPRRRASHLVGALMDQCANTYQCSAGTPPGRSRRS
jgi:hypothetical protein